MAAEQDIDRESSHLTLPYLTVSRRHATLRWAHRTSIWS